MMSDSYRQLDELMQREIDAVARLRTLLEQEQSALRSRDVDGIERVVIDKQGLVEELERYGSQREQLLRASGFSADKSGFQSFLRAAGTAGGQLTERWQRLRQDLKGCQTQNLVNGQILEASRRRAEQSLSILVGNPPGQRANTYDRRGGTQLSLGGRSFAKA